MDPEEVKVAEPPQAEEEILCSAMFVIYKTGETRVSLQGEWMGMRIRQMEIAVRRAMHQHNRDLLIAKTIESERIAREAAEQSAGPLDEPTGTSTESTGEHDVTE